MDLLYPRCAGLDVHPRSVSACTRVVTDGQVVQEVRTFGTSTRELKEMADWLAASRQARRGVIRMSLELRMVVSLGS